MRKIAMHDKSVVLVLSHYQADYLRRTLKSGWVYRSKTLAAIQTRLATAIMEVAPDAAPPQPGKGPR